MARIQPGEQVYRASQTIGFVEAGITPVNMRKIYLIRPGFPPLVFFPDLLPIFNQINQFEAGEGYYLIGGNESVEIPALDSVPGSGGVGGESGTPGPIGPENP